METQKLDFKENATSKVGSKDNMEHQAGGGDKKVTFDCFVFLLLVFKHVYFPQTYIETGLGIAILIG